MEKSIFKKKNHAKLIQVPLTNSVSCPAVSKMIKKRDRETQKERGSGRETTKESMKASVNVD